ncbi:hypothetical protein GQX74_011140 [Glossina fuscipes]|nr:hypothetical protein GQX74_011140 [Glossina fuscipes]
MNVNICGYTYLFRENNAIYLKNNVPNDVRPYADVILFGKKITDLLISDASITCIGNKLAKTYFESGKPLKRIKSSIRTADDNLQSISGFIETVISFRGVEKLIQIFVNPTLSKDLYLGYDFGKLYDLMSLG